MCGTKDRIMARDKQTSKGEEIMKMDVHDSQGLKGENVELEVILPAPIDTRIYNPTQLWTFRFTFQNNFVTVVTLDKYKLKALLSALVGSL